MHNVYGAVRKFYPESRPQKDDHSTDPMAKNGGGYKVYSSPLTSAPIQKLFNVSMSNISTNTSE